VAVTRLCPFCLEPLTACVCPDTEACATAPAPCCDLHGRNCDPPSELCCENCTEARHGGWTDERGNWRYGHPRGEACSNPDLSSAGGERM